MRAIDDGDEVDRRQVFDKAIAACCVRFPRLISFIEITSMNDDENDRAARLMADIFGRAWAADAPKQTAIEPGAKGDPKKKSAVRTGQPDAPVTASFARGSRTVSP